LLVCSFLAIGVRSPLGVSCRAEILALDKYDYGIMTMIGALEMKKMAAGSFKIHCLAVMDEVQAKRETVVITKHGKPVAKLVPADKNTDDIYNFLVGKGAIAGDIVSPAISDKEWGELK
jgi:prevent-host-death family protein